MSLLEDRSNFIEHYFTKYSTSVRMQVLSLHRGGSERRAIKAIDVALASCHNLRNAAAYETANYTRTRKILVRYLYSNIFYSYDTKCSSTLVCSATIQLSLIENSEI